MSVCVVCHKDSKHHTKKLWQEHKTQLTGNCIFCKKPKHGHSKELLQMHRSTVESAAGARKLHSVQTFGRIRPYPALLIDTRVYIWKNTQMQDLQPIYMSCANKNCGKFLGSLEEDFADLLSGLCLVCFREQTGQAEMN